LTDHHRSTLELIDQGITIKRDAGTDVGQQGVGGNSVRCWSSSTEQKNATIERGTGTV